MKSKDEWIVDVVGCLYHVGLENKSDDIDVRVQRLVDIVNGAMETIFIY